MCFDIKKPLFINGLTKCICSGIYMKKEGFFFGKLKKN